MGFLNAAAEHIDATSNGFVEEALSLLMAGNQELDVNWETSTSTELPFTMLSTYALGKLPSTFSTSQDDQCQRACE